MSASSQNHARRFSGLDKLYGVEGFSRITQSHAAVIGVGGVGSWVVESLARSGIGKLTLIDMDHLAESNINRQLPALDSTLGQAKVLALRDRIAQINLSCEVRCVEDFISADNLDALLSSIEKDQYKIVIDCIDHAKTKAALIAWCRQQKFAVLTVGGAGACIDPARITRGDLARTQNDVLLARTRKQLRQAHGFPRNPKRRFCVPAVYTDETRLDSQLESCDTLSQIESGLNCAGYGSVVHMTAGLGFAAAGRALEILLREEVESPDVC